jgi:hypothetical protein
MVATNARASADVYVRMGRITSNKMRSCDTVSAGAFFFQADFQVPQKEVRQHTRQDMVMPAWIFAYFILGHAQFGFGLLKALFNRPPHAT